MTMSLRSRLTLGLVAIVLCLSVGLASADTITVEGTTSGSFSILGLPLVSVGNGYGVISNAAGSIVRAVLEPATLALVLAGLVGVAATVRCRRNGR